MRNEKIKVEFEQTRELNDFVVDVADSFPFPKLMSMLISLYGSQCMFEYKPLKSL